MEAEAKAKPESPRRFRLSIARSTRSTMAASVLALASRSMASGSDAVAELREGIPKLAKDLDAFDRIDPKLGLEIKLEPKDLQRITGPLAHDVEQLAGDLIATGRRRGWRLVLRRRRNGLGLMLEQQAAASQQAGDEESRLLVPAVEPRRRGEPEAPWAAAVCRTDRPASSCAGPPGRFASCPGTPPARVQEPRWNDRGIAAGLPLGMTGTEAEAVVGLPLLMCLGDEFSFIDVLTGESWCGCSRRDSGAGCAGACPSRRGSGASSGRARLPLTIQVEELSGGEPSPAGRDSRSRSRCARPRVKPSQPHGQPGHRQPRRCVQQADKAGPAGNVAGDGEVRPVVQDRADKRSQYAARTDLHEHPGSLVVHRHDHVGKADRAGHMLAEPFGDRLRIGRMDRRIKIREYRARRAPR